LFPVRGKRFLFPTPSRLALRPSQPSPVSIPVAHLNLIPKYRMRGAIPSLPHTPALHYDKLTTETDLHLYSLMTNFCTIFSAEYVVVTRAISIPNFAFPAPLSRFHPYRWELNVNLSRPEKWGVYRVTLKIYCHSKFQGFTLSIMERPCFLQVLPPNPQNGCCDNVCYRLIRLDLVCLQFTLS
jgi:hypothetical protein